jgi:hypothetical protein
MKTNILKYLAMAVVAIFLSTGVALARDERRGYSQPKGHAYGHSKENWHKKYDHDRYYKGREHRYPSRYHQKNYYRDKYRKNFYHKAYRKNYYHKEINEHHHYYGSPAYYGSPVYAGGGFFGMSVVQPGFAWSFGVIGD